MNERNARVYTYKTFCIASCVISCVVSFADLNTIVRVVGPVLDACYPTAIVIAIYYCVCRNTVSTANLRAAKWSIIVTFSISIIELIARYNEMFRLDQGWIEALYNSMPLSAYSLAWLPVSIIVFTAVLIQQRGIAGLAASAPPDPIDESSRTQLHIMSDRRS